MSQTRERRIDALLQFVATLDYACCLVRADGTLSDASAFRVASYDAALANYSLIPNDERHAFDRPTYPDSSAAARPA